MTLTQGVDDILAMLLAFSTLPEELEILLVSVTYGNIDVANCLRNVVSLFYHIDKRSSGENRRVRMEVSERCGKVVRWWLLVPPIP